MQITPWFTDCLMLCLPSSPFDSSTQMNPRCLQLLSLQHSYLLLLHSQDQCSSTPLQKLKTLLKEKEKDSSSGWQSCQKVSNFRLRPRTFIYLQTASKVKTHCSGIGFSATHKFRQIKSLMAQGCQVNQLWLLSYWQQGLWSWRVLECTFPQQDNCQEIAIEAPVVNMLMLWSTMPTLWHM